MMSNPSSPSRPPLTFSAQRASPFRRPESPLGRSQSAARAPTSQGSPLKNSTPGPSPSKLAVPGDSPTRAKSSSSDSSWIKREPSPAPTPSKSPIPFQLAPTLASSSLDSPAPSAGTARPLPTRPPTAMSTRTGGMDGFSSIPPQHLHSMRESFSVLDRSNSGQIAPADVATALSELGLDSSSSTLSTYFPPGTSSLNLGAYLSLLSRDLSELSRQDELMGAFSAFDDDDSGQIDVAELRNALLNTVPENGQPLSPEEVDAALGDFIGRRVLKKGQVNSSLGGKKEVFRYGDFVNSIWGGTANGQQSVPN